MLTFGKWPENRPFPQVQSTTTCVANKKLETDIGITATILHARVLRWQIYWQQTCYVIIDIASGSHINLA